MLTRSRPDIFDAFVNLWLSAAVGMAAAATAPLEAFRAPLSESGEGEDLPAEEATAFEPMPVTVSPVRPDDLAKAPVHGLAADETCGNCRHFHRENSRVGECRFGAPFITGNRSRGEWPVTLENEWCGQFFKAHVPGITREDLDGLH